MEQTTPELPLKLRRKGCPDFCLRSPEPDSDFDMPSSSPLSTSYSSFGEFDVYAPRSPTFCSSSSSAAPSSPVRALFTPEPPSSPTTEPHIASSPKSFWEGAINYGSDHPYKLKTKAIAQPTSSRGHRHMGSRIISHSATSTLPPSSFRGTSEETDEGEMDVASVLLDLKRKVRVSPVLAEEPKREEPQVVRSPKDVSVDNAASGELREAADTEEEMDVDDTTPMKAEERVACSAIDTNQDTQHKPTVNIDPYLSQMPEPLSVVEATPTAVPVSELTLPTDVSPLVRKDNSEQIDGTQTELEAPAEIADVEVASTVIVPSSPIIELEPALGETKSETAFTPSLSVLSEPLSSPLSSPTLPSSPRPSTPASNSPSPVSIPLEVCEEIRPREGVDSVPSDPREQTNALPKSGTPPFESPGAGPSKPRVQSAKAKSNAAKRKYEDDITNEVTEAPEKAQDAPSSGESQPVKEKKKRQQRAKDTSPSATLDPSESGPVKRADTPKPRKRASKKLKETVHETSKRASSSVPPDHDQSAPSQASSSTDSPPKAVTCPNTGPVTSEQREDTIESDSAARAELAGLLVQAMALSRASSMPASSLLRELLRENPPLADHRSKSAWHATLESVLSSHDYFGRIQREGLDADDKPLEAQWFYIPEKDVDQERAALLREMMPKKRSATKTHKQYFYKPLGKISRWDSEDAL